MSHMERYRGPLRTAYLKIRKILPRNESDADCLQIVVKIVNDGICPEGLFPAIPVFGAVPRPAVRTPVTTQLEYQTAIEKAIEEVHNEQSRRRLAFGL